VLFRSKLSDTTTHRDERSGLTYRFNVYKKINKCVNCAMLLTDNDKKYCDTCIKSVNLCQVCNDEMNMSSQVCSRCVRK
jgi:hypothetical protein